MDVTSLALLTRRELDWLLGKTGDMSKSFKYKVKSSLKKKIQTFVEIELPLLLKNGLLPTTNDSFPLSTNYPLRDGISLDGNSGLGFGCEENIVTALLEDDIYSKIRIRNGD